MSGMEMNYIWTSTEFAILLSIFGADDVFMFPLPAEQSVERVEFLRAIYSLVESDCIKPTYTSKQPYMLSDDVRACLSPLAKASIILEFKFSDDIAEKLVFGLNERWTVVEPDLSGSAYRVRLLAGKEICDWFDELPVWGVDRLDTDEEIATLLSVDNHIEKDMEEFCANTSESIEEYMARCVERHKEGDVDTMLIPKNGYLYMLMKHDNARECCVYTQDARKRIREEFFQYGKRGN